MLFIFILFLSPQKTHPKNPHHPKKVVVFWHPGWLQGSGIASIHCRQDFLKHLAQTFVVCEKNGGWSTVIFGRYWGRLVGVWEIDGECVFWFGCHNWPSNGEWCCQICDPKRVHQLEAQKLTFASSHLHKDTESHLWVTGNKVFARHYQLDEFNRCLYQTSSASSQEILPCSCRSASIVGCWMCEAVAVWEGLWQC